jgi:hypothetical protein
MMKKTLMLLVVVVFVLSCVSVGFAQEKPKTYKLKGMIVVHPETKDIKVVDKQYQYHTIYYNKKTKVTATVKATTKEMEKEMTQSRLPKGSVTYIIKDGKKIATKISFTSRAKWGLKKKKKKK